MKLSILKKPIQNLAMSSEFKLMAEINQINTLEDLLKNPVHEMLRLNGFNYHRLDELIKYLIRHNLASKLIQM